jgi:hypothetical protein
MFRCLYHQCLVYLPRSRTSVPRRSQDTLLYYFTLWCSRSSRLVRPTQSSGVTSHYSIDSRFWGDVSLLDWFSSPLSLSGAADTIYIYTTSCYRDQFSYCHQISLRSEHLALQKSFTNIVQISRAFISLRKPLFFMKISWKFHEKLAFHFISFHLHGWEWVIQTFHFIFISQLSWNGGPKFHFINFISVVKWN